MRGLGPTVQPKSTAGMNVIVIAPHPDDEAIGCGGTMCLHSARGDTVSVVFLSSGELGLKDHPKEAACRIREREAEKAAEVLGVTTLKFLRYPDWYVGDATEAAARDVCEVLRQHTPNVIYLPHEHEAHPDHQAALPIVRAALALSDIPAPVLLTFEVWTPLPGYYHVEDITAFMNRKLKAIRCYRSQVKQLAYDRAVRGLNLYRGVVAGACRYAEIFENGGPPA